MKSTCATVLGVAALGVAVVGAAPGCGARTTLGVDESPTLPSSDGADGSACAPSCSNDTRGTWRLEDQNHVPTPARPRSFT